MLSVAECQKYLVGKNYTEQEIEEMRDILYRVAQVLVGRYLEEERKETSGQRINPGK